MSLETDLQTLLKEELSVTALVATNTRAGGDKCIRRERLYQSDQLPAIEIHIEDEQAVNDLQDWDGTVHVDVVLSCIAQRQGTARQIGRKCIEFLEPFRGATQNGFVDSVTLLRTRNAYFPYEDGSDDGEHVHEVHLKIWYYADGDDEQEEP